MGLASACWPCRGRMTVLWDNERGRVFACSFLHMSPPSPRDRALGRTEGSQESQRLLRVPDAGHTTAAHPTLDRLACSRRTAATACAAVTASWATASEVCRPALGFGLVARASCFTSVGGVYPTGRKWIITGRRAGNEIFSKITWPLARTDRSNQGSRFTAGSCNAVRADSTLVR